MAQIMPSRWVCAGVQSAGRGGVAECTKGSPEPWALSLGKGSVPCRREDTGTTVWMVVEEAFIPAIVII